MSNSPLVQYARLSPNCNSPRVYPIKKITIHHVAGVCSVETLGNIFAPVSRQASSNYGIGSDGRIALFVDEGNRSWCSSNWDNDQQAITIETSNSAAGGNWPVSDYVLSRLIDLCTDICKRNGIARLNFTGDASGNLTAHRYFDSTSCPGDYLYSKFPYIASEVNKRLQPQLNIEDIPNKKVQLKTDANLWNLDFNTYAEAKSVKAFKKGDILEVSAIAKHSIGSTYYLTEYSYSNKINNGFNIADCEDYVEPIVEIPVVDEPIVETPIKNETEVPQEEPIEDGQANTPTDTETAEKGANSEEKSTNTIISIVLFILKTIAKLLKGGK